MSEYISMRNSPSKKDSNTTIGHKLISDMKKTPQDDIQVEESEFDVPDDIDLDVLTEMQKRIIKEKKVLSKRAPELNDQRMRNAYIRQQVSVKQLVERKIEQKNVIKKYE